MAEASSHICGNCVNCNCDRLYSDSLRTKTGHQICKFIFKYSSSFIKYSMQKLNLFNPSFDEHDKKRYGFLSITLK